MLLSATPKVCTALLFMIRTRAVVGGARFLARCPKLAPQSECGQQTIKRWPNLRQNQERKILARGICVESALLRSTAIAQEVDSGYACTRFPKWSLLRERRMVQGAALARLSEKASGIPKDYRCPAMPQLAHPQQTASTSTSSSARQMSACSTIRFGSVPHSSLMMP